MTLYKLAIGVEVNASNELILPFIPFPGIKNEDQTLLV